MSCSNSMLSSNDVKNYVERGTSVALSYNANTGSGEVPESAYYDFGTSVYVSKGTSLSKSGYQLTGWNTKANGTGTAVNLGSSIVLDERPRMTLYAVWTGPKSITYDGNGSVSGTVPTDTGKYFSGESVSVQKNIGALSKGAATGYVFSGWNTASDGSGTGYAAGGTMTMGASDITLYARWKTIVGVGLSSEIILGNATLTSDHKGNENAAYAFTSGTSSISSSSSALKLSSASGFSISVWCLLTPAALAANAGIIWSMPSNAYELQYTLSIRNSALYVRVGQNYVWGVGNQFYFPASFDGWRNIVIVYNGGSLITAYVDGVFAGSAACAIPALALPTTRFAVGGGGFIGSIADLRVFTWALTASEIAALYLE